MEQAIIILSILLLISVVYNLLNNNKAKRLQGDISSELNQNSSLSQKNLNLNDKNRHLIKEIKKIKTDISKSDLKISELNKKIEFLEKGILEKDNLFSSLKNKSDSSISNITSLYSDFLLIQFDLSEHYLRTKKRPARKEAKRIKELKKETKVYNEKYRQMMYKYEYLLQLFPELTNFVDDFETLGQLEDANSMDDFKEDFDKVQNYVSKEEYLKLTIDERNQLALNRYIKGKKTNWQIGRDYELFCGLEYEKDGWNVEYFGMEKRLKDLGRDLIARKKDTIEIIQCKLWSKNKMIHEKHILQLYGTTIIEQLVNPDLFTKIKPVFITSTSLSETAQKFANILNVKVIVKDLRDFSRIKCNIGKDEFGKKTKIYHLPFDQHYDRTRILENKGFYAKDVSEATKKGFRRAFKYRVGKNAT